MNEQKAKEWKACNCPECVSMCERRPCWGTPEEIAELIAQGYGGRMMRDYWADYLDGDIPVISPAIVGHENKSAPFWPTGRCAFLTKDNKCELHNTGAKPREGRLAMHEEGESNRHKETAQMWDNDAAREIVEKWEQS